MSDACFSNLVFHSQDHLRVEFNALNKVLPVVLATNVVGARGFYRRAGVHLFRSSRRFFVERPQGRHSRVPVEEHGSSVA